MQILSLETKLVYSNETPTTSDRVYSPEKNFRFIPEELWKPIRDRIRQQIIILTKSIEMHSAEGSPFSNVLSLEVKGAETNAPRMPEFLIFNK